MIQRTDPWWNPWQGSDGVIYSTIDGAGNGQPIAECDDCSRVIKYMVTYGVRLGSNGLIQMRAHDTNIVTNLDKTYAGLFDESQRF